MSTSIKEPRELQSIYRRRFERRVDYRTKLWQALTEGYFQRFVKATDTVLDLGCGYGEFINQIHCGKKMGMDLNPQSRARLHPDIELLAQDCSTVWPLENDSLDVVFTSNFFEHLPDKLALRATIQQCARCLKPGGRLIALGPNIKYVQGAYWDFWDHFLCLTEMSLGEALENNGFQILHSHPRFLPYTTVGAPDFPPALVKLYLKMPWAWPLFGKQFLVVASRV